MIRKGPERFCRDASPAPGGAAPTRRAWGQENHGAMGIYPPLGGRIEMLLGGVGDDRGGVLAQFR
jgi:hypothetical protein